MYVCCCATHAVRCTGCVLVWVVCVRRVVGRSRTVRTCRRRADPVRAARRVRAGRCACYHLAVRLSHGTAHAGGVAGRGATYRRGFPPRERVRISLSPALAHGRVHLIPSSKTNRLLRSDIDFLKVESRFPDAGAGPAHPPCPAPRARRANASPQLTAPVSACPTADSPVHTDSHCTLYCTLYFTLYRTPYSSYAESRVEIHTGVCRSTPISTAEPSSPRGQV